MKKLYEIMCPPAVVTAGGHMILYSFWAIQPRGVPPYYPVDGVQHMLHAAQPGAGWDVPRRRGTAYATPCPSRCWMYPIDRVQHMPHPAQPGAGCTPSTGYSICYTMPNQVLDVSRRRGTAYATPRLTRCWMYPVDGVQHILHHAQPGAGCISTRCPTRCWM
jgi:hypothetical protein